MEQQRLPSNSILQIPGSYREISIASDDSDENPYNFTIQGTGLTAPTVTTQAVSSIGTTNATGNGNITDLGYPHPTAYGPLSTSATRPPDNVIDNGQHRQPGRLRLR